MGNNKTLLKALLRAVLDNWGYGEVRAALDEAAGRIPQGENGDHRGTGAAPVKKRKPTASEQVDHAEVGESRRAVLRDLAVRFENKQFLPTNSDVKEFLATLGVMKFSSKDRPDAFRHVLRALLKLSDERLARVATSGRHSGPAQLGPLSDAISSAADSMQRRRGGKEPDAVVSTPQRPEGKEKEPDATSSMPPRLDGVDLDAAE